MEGMKEGKRLQVSGKQILAMTAHCCTIDGFKDMVETELTLEGQSSKKQEKLQVAGQVLESLPCL